MIERLAHERTDRLAEFSSAREHQDRVRGGMGAKDLEHPTLVFRAEMKKAVLAVNLEGISKRASSAASLR